MLATAQRRWAAGVARSTPVNVLLKGLPPRAASGSVDFCCVEGVAVHGRHTGPLTEVGGHLDDLLPSGRGGGSALKVPTHTHRIRGTWFTTGAPRAEIPRIIAPGAHKNIRPPAAAGPLVPVVFQPGNLNPAQAH